MRVTFFGIPRSLIRDSQTRRIIARFDKNGRYTTEDELLINRMKQRGFQWEEKEVIEEKIVAKSAKVAEAKKKIEKFSDEKAAKDAKKAAKAAEKKAKKEISEPETAETDEKPVENEKNEDLDEAIEKEIEPAGETEAVENPYLEKTHDELKALAKEKEMKGNYWLMSAETLAEELFKLDNEVK